MSAEGIPGIIVVSRELRNFQKNYNDTCSLYNKRIDELQIHIDQCYVDLPDQIVRILLENFQINGVSPITLGDIRTIISDMLTSHNGPLQTIIEKLDRISDNQHASATTSLTIASSNNDVVLPLSNEIEVRGQYFYWHLVDDKVHKVPYGFKWPSHDLSTMYRLWIYGCSNSNIGPYHQISAEDDLVAEGCKVNCSKTKIMMKVIISAAIRKHVISHFRDIKASVATSREVYKNGYEMLINLLYVDRSCPRPNETNIYTLYNRMKKMKLVFE